MMFSLDVEKMFTSLKRDKVRKEVERLIKDGEIIRHWNKEEIMDNLEYILDNQYCIIEEDIVKIKKLMNGFKNEPSISRNHEKMGRRKIR